MIKKELQELLDNADEIKLLNSCILLQNKLDNIDTIATNITKLLKSAQKEKTLHDKLIDYKFIHSIKTEYSVTGHAYRYESYINNDVCIVFYDYKIYVYYVYNEEFHVNLPIESSHEIIFEAIKCIEKIANFLRTETKS